VGSEGGRVELLRAVRKGIRDGQRVQQLAPSAKEFIRRVTFIILG
jgi:hypothetical protein